MSRKVLVCTGGHCRRRLRELGAARDGFDRLEPRIRRVGCQKVCRGPVVGFEVDDALIWFERMDSKKAWRALEALVENGKMAKTLRKRRNRKRAGRLR